MRVAIGRFRAVTVIFCTIIFIVIAYFIFMEWWFWQQKQPRDESNRIDIAVISSISDEEKTRLFEEVIDYVKYHSKDGKNSCGEEIEPWYRRIGATHKTVYGYFDYQITRGSESGYFFLHRDPIYNSKYKLKYNYFTKRKAPDPDDIEVIREDYLNYMRRRIEWDHVFWHLFKCSVIPIR